MTQEQVTWLAIALTGVFGISVFISALMTLWRFFVA